MQRNKYLDDLGIPIDKYGVNFCDDNDSRTEFWKSEREKYGFDERETWNLDQIFIEWLYSHLMMYKEYTIVDLSYHRYEFEGKTYTQGECIDFIIEKLRSALLVPYYDGEEVRKAIQMWAEVYGACWW